MSKRKPIVRVSGSLQLALAALAGGAAAHATTFAPGTRPEYIQHVKETLRLQAEAMQPDGERFTPGFNRQIFSRRDPREANPADRAYQIWWSYAQEGLAMEVNPGVQFHPVLSVSFGGDEPLDPEDGNFDNFQSVLFTRLNGLPRPFGFAQDGGQRRWQEIVREAFIRWDQVCAVEFVFVPGGFVDNDSTVEERYNGAIADQPNGDGGGDWDNNAFGRPEFGNTGEGDIRIAMADIDGPTQPDGFSGGILAWTYHPNLPPAFDTFDDNGTDMDPSDDISTEGYCANITLDREERWNDPTTPNLLSVVITREIGFALGLLPACPSNPEVPIALMQIQDFAGPGTPGAQEPLPPLFFTELQEDDIRSVHSIYGDSLDTWGDGGNTTDYTEAADIFFQPVPGTNVFTYKPHLGIPEETFPLGPAALSIHDADDIDRWRLGIPDSVTSGTLTITIEPQGASFLNDVFMLPAEVRDAVVTGSCTNAPFEDNALAVQDLTIRIEAYDPFTNVLTLIDEVNANPAGLGEEVEIPVTTGTYYISVFGNIIPNVQLYDISIVVETPLLESGIEADEYLDVIDVEAFYEEGFFGANSTIGVVDGEHFAQDHDVFAGRAVPKVNWPGVQPAATSAGSHSTVVAGVAAGAPIGAFAGIAPEASIASATVATEVFGDGTFAIGKSALYFALMGLADPTMSDTLGLPEPSSVVIASFGGGGRTLNGEDTISQAFDVVASQTAATFVIAAGNGGQVEGQSFANCLIQNPDNMGPGAAYLGYRTIVPPATSYNSIVVGSTGLVDPITSPPEFAEQQLIVAGFSSRGPIDSSTNTPGGGDLPDRRSGVHVIAPGGGLTQIPPDYTPEGGVPLDPCDYDGPEPLSLLLLPSIDPGDDPDAPANPGSFQLVQGSSVSAAIVGGAVALLQDVAREQDPPLSIHPSVMKAIIMNGAEKLEGWTNNAVGPGRPQDQRDGFERNPIFLDADPNNDDDRFLVYNLAINTANPLDRAQGAGALNLRRSLENYFTGYPAAQPPQAQFDGPTIDPPETSPLVPTIRMPDEPTGPGGPPAQRPADEGGDAGQEIVGPSDQIAPTDAEVERMRSEQRGREPSILIGRQLQVGGGRNPDLKGHQGGSAGFTTTGPQTPFQIPALGGDDGTPGGPPGGTPGAIEPGARPLEIPPVFVDPIGWDHANIDQRSIRQANGNIVVEGFIDYVIDVPLLAQRADPANPGGAPLPADRITITLCWQRLFRLTELNFSNLSAPVIGTVQALELENLNLELFPCDSLGNIQPGTIAVRSSIATFNNTEHIFADVPLSSLYLIRVRWVNTNYDTRLNQPLAEQQYGLAWRVDFSPRSEALRPANASDLVNVLGGFGGQVGNERYSIPADFDLNGRVDWKDIIAVLRNWGG